MQRLSILPGILVLLCLLISPLPLLAQDEEPNVFLPLLSSGGPAQPEQREDAGEPNERDHRASEPIVKSAESEAVTAGSPIINWEYDQINPAAEYSSKSNSYLGVWEDHHWGWGNDWDIYGREVGADGLALGSQFGISWDGSQQRLSPAITYNSGADEYLVVWEYAHSATDHDIYARRVGPAGALLSGEIPIAVSTQMDSNPAVAYDAASNSYLIVWQYEYSASDRDIYGRLISATGAALSDAFPIASSGDDQMAPDVSDDSVQNQYLVVWQARSSSSSDFNIYGRLVANTGLLSGAELAIETWSGDQVAPRTAFDARTSAFGIVWQDGHWDYWKTDVFGQIVSSSGELRQHFFGNGTSERAERPDIVYIAPTHGYLVVWEHEYNVADHDIYRRLISGTGTPLSQDLPVAQSGSNEGGPVVVPGADWNAYVAWEDARAVASTGIDLYGERTVVALPTFTGHVYNGASGTTTNPLAGVTLQMYCSNNAGSPGWLLAETTTDSAGYYVLYGYEICEYYGITETDLPNYVSVSASSADGTIMSSNWIRFEYPLGSKNLTSNDFWDQLSSGGDQIPPDNWANFSPPGWTAAQTLSPTVQVEDGQSGLAVARAQYAISRDAGASWSPLQTAVCTGVNGTTAPQTLTASSASFAQDSSSAGLNQIKFRISDLAGNVGESPAYSVLIDSVPPQNPAQVTCTPQAPNVWSGAAEATCSWLGAADALSGLDGFWYVWDHLGATVPSQTNNPGYTANPTAAHTLQDGANWYFHVQALDKAGNTAAGAVHLGPFLIDVTPPDAAVTQPSGAVGSTTFPVVWGGTDSGSGIQDYDVEFQDVTAGGPWTLWQDDVTVTTATFNAASGHTYRFRALGRDRAGNRQYPDYWPGFDTQAVVETEDFFTDPAGALEVTQAVQDRNNSVVLIEGKDTYVRFYVNSSMGDRTITAQLKGRRGATNLGTLQPNNPGGTIVARASNDRLQLGQSFWFKLPKSWLSGQIGLHAEANYDRRLAESNYANNDADSVVSFQQTPALRIVFVPVTYTLSSAVRQAPAAAQTDIRSWLERAYPVATVSTMQHATTIAFSGNPTALCSSGGWATLDGQIAKLHSTSTTDLGANTIYLGIVPNDYATQCTGATFTSGRANGIPSTDAAAVVLWTAADTGANASHEIAHSLNRYHAECCGASGGVSYPYPSCHISSEDNRFVGFDIQSHAIYAPASPDLMSYCDSRWMSDFTYKGLRDQIVKYPLVEAAQSEATNVLLVSGLINRTKGQAVLDPVYRIPALATAQTQPGSCTLVLRNTQNAAVAEYAFTPFIDTQPRAGQDNVEVVHELLPDNPSAVQVDLVCGGTLLASQHASSNAPSVRLLVPNGGEQWANGSQTISWQASDADGDALHSLVQVSHDNGTTWTTLAADVGGTTYTFDTSFLGGSDQALVRVFVSDGLWTAQDTSDQVFSIAGKAPKVDIESPSSGSIFAAGEPIAAKGYAYDVQEGMLTDNQLTWQSDRDGVLGSGRDLAWTAPTAGVHTLTLSATNSSGLTSSASVQLYVGPSKQLYLPVVFKARQR